MGAQTARRHGVDSQWTWTAGPVVAGGVGLVVLATGFQMWVAGEMLTLLVGAAVDLEETADLMADTVEELRRLNAQIALIKPDASRAVQDLDVLAGAVKARQP